MLFLDGELEKIVRAEGEKAYPNECCGVLIGEADYADYADSDVSDGIAGAKRVRHVQAIDNAREGGEQYHRFLITPEDMLRAEQAARAMKLDVIGFYHSHPDHPAAPSDYDREHALPSYSYVIVSVQQGKAEDLTSWELTANRVFEPENITKQPL